MSSMQQTIDANPWQQAANNRWDMVGACLSLMCLAHCIILPFLPFLLAALPWLENEYIHLSLLAMVVPISSFAFFRGLKRHGSKTPLLWGAAGILMVLAGPVSGEALEKPLTVIGAIVLCVGHWQNRKHTLGA